jgi:hypothetical protein
MDKESLRPQHFLCRPGGELTALIAVDELPSSIVIHGVPRVLGLGETSGMMSLGTLPCRNGVYGVDITPEGPVPIPSPTHTSTGHDVAGESTEKPTVHNALPRHDSQQSMSAASKEPIKGVSFRDISC